MASNYDSIDLDFSWDGDLILDPTGDIKDTSDDYLLSLKNEIFSRVKSNLGDWREARNLGADADDFIGEPNNRRTADNLKTRIQSSLVDIVASRDLSIRILPVHIHTVLVMINVSVLPTKDNKLKPGEQVAVSFLYDYFENGVYVDIEQMTRFSGRGY